MSACLERLIHERNHIALIRDLEEKVVGMITMEDILEELVGEIHDEYDRLPSYVTKSGNSWVVGGFAKLAHVREVTGIDLPINGAGEPPTTVNDWVIHQLGRPVKGGEVIEGRRRAGGGPQGPSSTRARSSNRRPVDRRFAGLHGVPADGRMTEIWLVNSSPPSRRRTARRRTRPA